MGRVKTRLAAELGAVEACRLALRMLEHSLILASKHWPGAVYCAVWPNPSHRAVQQLCQRYKVELLNQSAGHLGTKMSNMFIRFSPCAIIGSDIPHCPPSILKTAAHRLVTGKNVIGPSEDGGYYLMALQRPAPALFQNVEWGTDRVYQQTLDAARTAKLELSTLDKHYDLDHNSDLKRLIDHHPEWAVKLTAMRTD